MEDDGMERDVAAVHEQAYRAASTLSWVARIAVVGAVVAHLPLWVLIPAISLAVGGGPLAAWIVGTRAARDLPEDHRARALSELDHGLKGSAQLSSIRGRWLVSRFLLASVILVGCLLLFAL